METVSRRMTQSIDETTTANESFTIDELGSPSPRQASVSFSTVGSCPLDYSDDLETLPVSPVSHDEDDCSCDRGGSSCPGDSCISRVSLKERIDSDESTNKKGDATTAVKPEPEPEPLFHPKQTSDCDKRNAKGQSALSVSASGCFLEGVKLLCEKGADVNLRDLYGRTPLHHAVANTSSELHHDCVSYLLERGADVNAQDKVHGRAPLHIACAAGCLACVQLLLKHGAQTNIKNNEGDLPLHVTAKYGHFDCMQALSPEVTCDGSHSSVESVSPSLLFGLESDAPASSIYQSFRTAPREIDVYQQVKPNDSGYFTARGGSAWVKSSYYSSGKIDEEQESSHESSTTGTDVSSEVVDDKSDDSGSERNDITEEDSIAVRALVACVGLVLRLAVYLLRSMLAWSAKRGKSGQLAKAAAPGDLNYQFIEPPDHVADAMRRFRDLQQTGGPSELEGPTRRE